MKFAMALLVLWAALPAQAQVKRQYDETGRYIGRETRQGDIDRFYDAQGRYQGYDTRSRDGTERHYDAQGRYLGRTTRPPQ